MAQPDHNVRSRPLVSSDEQPRSSGHTLSRRTLLAAVPGLALIAAGVACGDDDDDTSAASTATTAPTTSADTSPTAADEASPTAAEEGTTEESGGSGWTFIDDRGETISRDIQPTRVVAYLPIAASLWDFGLEVVGVFGTTLRPDGTPEIYAGNVDLDKVVSLGETYGEIDLEKLVDLKPELVVFDIYDAAEFDLWGLPGDAVDQVASIADLVGISFVGAPVTSTIERIGELAEAVGADLSAAAVVGDRDAFETASQSVRDALADKAELPSLFVAAWPENLYVANPQIWGDLLYFKELGLDIVVPDVPEKELWETLSWEQANKYPSDIILNDARATALTEDDLAGYPTWQAHPAVKAGQVGPWFTEFVPSYLGFTTVLDSLVETISGSDPDVV